MATRCNKSETCRSDNFTDLVILQEHRGIPDGIVVSHMPYGPTAYFGLHNVVMRHDIPQCALCRKPTRTWSLIT